MRKITVLLLLAVTALCSVQLSAKNGPDIPDPMRSDSYTSIPTYFHSLGAGNHMYYHVDRRRIAGPEYQYAVCLLGEINGRYYSSTYGKYSYFEGDDGYGGGFLAALQVDQNPAAYVDNRGTFDSGYGVTLKTDVVGQGEVAARIIYTLTNSLNRDVTIQLGVYADIMIGNDDDAGLKYMEHDGEPYGLRLRGKRQNNIYPIMSVLFGEGVTGVTPSDQHWFGFYSSNWHANEMVGNYTKTIYNTGTESYDQSYAQYWEDEDGGYDSGMGFCWNDRVIPAGGSIELSYLVAVGEVDFEEPIPDPDDPEGQDIFTYQVEAENIGDVNIDDPWNDLTVAHPAHIWGKYEHPYGQNGYIEYRVDGEGRGEWTRIETPLISGEESYDLPFNMFFNPDEDVLHTLELRFTDGLGNYTELDGLEWEDIRTISLTADPVTQVYDGTPKTFTVSLAGGAIDYVVGENGEYVNPGTYSQSIWGQYDMNTIGINTVYFYIDKATPQITVVVPDDTEYDGQAHGATVTVEAGDGTPIVTYVNQDMVESNEDPVNIGTYVVIVEVPETEFYHALTATSYGQFSIYEGTTGIEELSIDAQDKGAWYTIDGRRVAAPTERGIYIHNGKKYLVF